MKEKDKYLGLEFLFTFCLLNICIFMLGESVSTLRPYLISGLIFSFCFSWFIRNKSLTIMNIIINIGAVLVCLWIVYSVLKSSFFYREVILISVKGVFVLEIILILGAYIPLSLSYIQILSIPIFMGSPLFIEGFSLSFMLLAVVYIICWLAILRIKLYALVDITERRNVKWHYSIFVGVILFLISIIVSWELFYKFTPGRYTKGGLFPEEEISGEGRMENLEKEYYDLQDKINRQLTEIASGLDSTQKAKELLNLFSALINEALDPMELDKAKEGLISYLKTPGFGLEKKAAEESTQLIKSYVDKRAMVNLKRNKDNISDSLKTNSFNLKEKISGLNLANKIQYGKMSREVQQSEKQAREMIDNSLVNKEIKSQLKDFFRQFREWKDYNIYRQKINFLNKKIESLDVQSKKEAASLVSQIEMAQNLSDFQEIDKQLQKSKEAAPGQLKEVINEAIDLLNLKHQILLSLESKDLKEKLEEFNLNEYKLQEFKQQIEAIKNSENIQEFVKDSEELKENLKKEEVDVYDKLKEIWENKIRTLMQEEISKAREALKETTLADSGEGFLKELEKLESEKSVDKVDSGIKKLQRKISDFKNQGFISEETKNELKKIIEEIKQLFLFKINNNIGVEAGVPQEEPALPEERPSIPVSIVPEPIKLISIILSPENATLSMKDSLDLKAEGYYSDSSRKDITSLVEWKNDRPYIIKIKQGKVKPVWFGRALVRAEYSGIRSLPANIKVIFTLVWLAEIFLKLILFIILSMTIISIGLFFLIEIEKNKLKAFFHNAPREFIINLYENFKRIMAVFGLSNKEHLPPLAYAKLIESRHSIEENVLLRFTIKFEEAKYSKHILQSDDALDALNCYNDFLDTLFIRYNKFSLFYKYCLSLLYRIPFGIINI